jgi:crotonobetainyl-CoA:carnitine CoA-transferase CaiB-like acyl-CoA transferase
MADGPLRGVRILDLTHVWAGPLAVRVLADLGAEVVKVEAPDGRGPRQFPEPPAGGFLAGDAGEEPWNRNAAFAKLMRNRRSLCIDLKTSAGRDTFLALARIADVVMENFSPRTMPSLDLGYATLRSENPGLVYVALSGFGARGSWCDRVAFGSTVEPLTGLADALGYGPGEPRCTAMALADPIAALTMASACVTALRRRAATGVGAYIDLSMHECGVDYSGPWLVERQFGGHVVPIGNRHPAMAPHGVYPCTGEDAWVAIACADDAEWRALCGVLGAGLDPGLTLPARRAAHDVIDSTLARWTRNLGKHEAVAILQAAGVPAGPVNTAPDMLADAQIVARQFFVPLDEQTPMPGNPVRMPGLSTADWTPCPGLGADNHAVLRDWLGYADDRIGELERTGVLANEPPP